MSEADTSDGLICAYLLDGNGGGRQVGWAEVESYDPQHGLLWMHMDIRGSRTAAWLRQSSGIDAVICDTLLAEESRPRFLEVGSALMVILRGVNLNPGAEPDDMVAIRCHVEGHRIISLRFRNLLAIKDMRAELAVGKGFKSPGSFLARLSARLADRIGDVVDALDDDVTRVEEGMVDGEDEDLAPPGDIGAYRKTVIRLRRYIAPQRDALDRIPGTQVSWMSHRHRSQVREVADQMSRLMEDLGALRDRLEVLHDETRSRLTQHMNITIYRLTIVATILLPLTLVAGLLGVNVGGIPGADSPWGFAVVLGLSVGIGVIEIWLLKHFKWI